MREVKTTSASEEIMRRLAGMYDRLYELCKDPARRARTSCVIDYDDMFHDCLLTVAKDIKCLKMSDQRLVSHVVYRMNMIAFLRTKEYETEQMIFHNYADDSFTPGPEEGPDFQG